MALCYCKLDYYDVSLEILGVYLNAFPDSALAINLKACNHFRCVCEAMVEACWHSGFGSMPMMFFYLLGLHSMQQQA